MNKIIPPHELKKIISKREGIPVLSGGKFEFLVPGHIDLFEYCRSIGSSLIIIMKNGNALIPVDERLEILSAVQLIDHIIYEPDFSTEELILSVTTKGVIVDNPEFKVDKSLFSDNFKFAKFKFGPAIYKTL